jgi:hypothetical protein
MTHLKIIAFQLILMLPLLLFLFVVCQVVVNPAKNPQNATQPPP